MVYRVALINMPFAAVDYPSLALGLFKSRLERDEIPCTTYYLNIVFAKMIGCAAYNDLITRPPAFFAAEQLFAESCFGSAVPADQDYYDASELHQAFRQRLQGIKAYVEPFLAYCLTQIPWREYELIGFTSLFEQNLATLTLARRLKWLFPEKILVFGGPNFEGVMGHTFHRLLPFIDYVCSGEADDSFPELIKRLTYHHPINDLPGIVYRNHGESHATPPAPMMSRLDELPIADFSEYFEQVRAVELPPGVDACVLLETSRGCWWGEKNHCTFCGLNSQSMTYRSKSAGRAVKEIETLKNRHGIRFVRVVDNILNNYFFDELLPQLARKQLGVTIFFEVKANLRKHQIKALRDAGVTIVQAGIESLSTHTLKLMRKGSNSLMNVQTLKWCREYGVRCDWNLIYGFPGEQPEDYRLSVELAEVLSYLDPPTGCGPIRMDRFSPNYDHAAKMGFKNVMALKYYNYIYPFSKSDLHDVAYYFDFDYVEPIDDGGYLPALHNAVVRWKHSQDQLYAVSYGEYTVICDSRPMAAASYTTLAGIEQLVFEACDHITTSRRIQQTISRMTGRKVAEEEIEAILADFIGRHLVIHEDNRFLSLPVLTYEPLQNKLETHVPMASPAHGVDLVTV